MFICDQCLKDGFSNQPSFLRSYGPCEICGKSAVCNDIPSVYLVAKQKAGVEEGE